MNYLPILVIGCWHDNIVRLSVCQSVSGSSSVQKVKGQGHEVKEEEEENFASSY